VPARLEGAVEVVGDGVVDLQVDPAEHRREHVRPFPAGRGPPLVRLGADHPAVLGAEARGGLQDAVARAAGDVEHHVRTGLVQRLGQEAAALGRVVRLLPVPERGEVGRQDLGAGIGGPDARLEAGAVVLLARRAGRGAEERDGAGAGARGGGDPGQVACVLVRPEVARDVGQAREAVAVVVHDDVPGARVEILGRDG